MSDRIPPLLTLRDLTRELRALHEAWLHPDAGGEYVSLVCEVVEGWRVAPVGMVDSLWIAYADPTREDSLMSYGREYVPGSVERECGFCVAERIHAPRAAALCPKCHGAGRVHVPSSFDATAAARRLLAAARDAGCR